MENAATFDASGTERAGATRAELGVLLERDLDLLLLLDGQVGGPLVRCLLEKAGLSPKGPIRVARSTYRGADARQTDVEVSWDGGALLVENKLESPFTPGQATSYRNEVARRRDAEQQAAWVMVCPQRRHQSLAPDTEGRDCVVTFEELADAAEAVGPADSFAQAAACWLRAAAQPVPGTDPARSAWGDGYREAIRQALPGTAMAGPGDGSLRTATATAAEFRTSGVDPMRVWKLLHLIPEGVVRMELDISDDDLVSPPARAAIVRKPQMRWLEIAVPPMSMDVPAQDQMDGVRSAAEAIVVLRAWAIEHLAHLGYQE